MIHKPIPLRRLLPVFVSGIILLLLAASAYWGNWQLVAFQLAIIVLTLAGLMLLLRRRLTLPLAYLQQSVRRIAQGDLDTRIDAASCGDFTELACDLDQMRVAFSTTAKERARTLAMLQEREQNLAKTTAILERTGEMAKVGGWESDLRTMRVTWSEETYRIYEVDPSVILSMEYAMSFYGTNAEAIYQSAVQPVIDSGSDNSWYLELPITTAKGNQKWVRFQGAAQRENGELVGLIGTIQDITEQIQAEAELRIAATAFNSQEGMFVTDLNNRILKVNQAFTAITGYTADDVVGRDPKLFNSGLHDANFYAEMWASINETGVWRGEIWNRRKNGETYAQWLTISSVKDRTGTTTHYVGAFTDITERLETEKKIENLAFFDPLTGLPNRRLLLDRLAHVLATAIRQRQLGALLFIDLDDFKILNDTYGHDKGDQLLQQVAERLSSTVRKADTVGRLGGDEFVVLLENIGPSMLKAAAEAKLVGEKILAALGQPYVLNDNMHRSTPSVGITLFGDIQESIEEPLKRADLAMYQAKAAGRNTLRFFDPQIQVAIATRSQLENDLRAAIADNEFLLLYQPQITGETNLAGAEALIRWQHPKRGIVSPAEFIPLAEETGLIVSLGRWVLDRACIQLAHWAAQPETDRIAIAVNVSPRQFHQPDFVDQVMAAIDMSGANPKLLKLELTESILVSSMEDVIAKMSELKRFGVGFSLDDFGTGYSSLAYLKRLPLDQLKIDQSFVRDILTNPNDASIAKTIIALADSLGLQVIAEGVETEEQRRFLAALGCSSYQGYLFSRPVPATAFEEFAERIKRIN